mgnify:CR=1 FL=1
MRVGPGDDCAVVAGDGIALSTDMSVEGVHFRRDWLAPEEIGWRAAAAALSDLAAMAARPIGILVSLAAPREDAGDYAVRVMAGCRDAVESCGGVLLGGDLTRSPGPLVVDVTVVGEAPRPVLRSGARLGEELWVTGELGGSAACVEALLDGRTPDAAARERFARPRPRVREAQWLRERGIPTAMVDVSDGLAGDAAHLSAASGVAMLLVPELIPVHPAAHERSRIRSLRRALGGGEDYELCFTAAAGTVQPLVDEFEGEFGARRLARTPLFAAVTGGVREYTQEDFFGLGPRSGREAPPLNGLAVYRRRALPGLAAGAQRVRAAGRLRRRARRGAAVPRARAQRVPDQGHLLDRLIHPARFDVSEAKPALPPSAYLEAGHAS